MNAAETGPNAPVAVLQTVYTYETRVSCNGGGGALGHPQVWLTLSGDGWVTCPYCSRLFVAAMSKSENS